MRLWYLSHRCPAKAQARSLARALAIRTHEIWKQMKGPTNKPHWMAEHAPLKNDVMEDKKCHDMAQMTIYAITHQESGQRNFSFTSPDLSRVSSSKEVHNPIRIVYW